MNNTNDGCHTYRNYQKFLTSKLTDIMTNGVEHETRVGYAKELYNQTYSLLKPTERFISLTARKNNPVATIAETLWVLAGRSDIAFLEPYLKRAKDYSDDGLSWRAGYGPRLRHWHGEIDQIKYVVDLLKRDVNSRRAVISLWDPSLDHTDSLDIPCNDMITFSLRKDMLNMTVMQRSNDIVWGSMINSFEWSVLLEVVASSLGASVGSITYNVVNLHLYEHHYDLAKQVISENMGGNNYLYDITDYYAVDRSSPVRSGLLDFYDDVDNALEIAKRSLNPEYDVTTDDDMNLIASPFVRDCTFAIAAYNKCRLSKGAFKILDNIDAFDIRAATHAHLRRMSEKEKPKISHNYGNTVEEIKIKLTKLQNEKGKVYGDSWKKHGEVLSIFANISRKFDRIEAIHAGGLSKDELNGEILEDTLADMAVYCVLYASWISKRSFSLEMSSISSITVDRITEASRLEIVPSDEPYNIMREAYNAIEANIVGGGMMYNTSKHTYVRLMAQAAIAWMMMCD